jgi:hypothetical protein
MTSESFLTAGMNVPPGWFIPGLPACIEILFTFSLDLSREPGFLLPNRQAFPELLISDVAYKYSWRSSEQFLPVRND